VEEFYGTYLEIGLERRDGVPLLLRPLTIRTDIPRRYEASGIPACLGVITLTADGEVRVAVYGAAPPAETNDDPDGMFAVR
jgi:hypothetical protein